jgi:probable O-glycosylation ligase (exosortase A-associated)
MRSLFLLFIFFGLLGLGLRAPFVLVLGYVWVDLVSPQTISYMILPALPVSLIFGTAACAAAVFAPRDPSISLRPTLLLLIVLATWMTVSLAWAAVPDAATEKWSWAVKTVVFSCMVPYLVRTRVHLEALLWAIVLCGMAHAIPFGSKVFLSGGGYGKALGLASGNAGLAEGSTLAMFSTMLIPFCWFLWKHCSIVTPTRQVKLMLVAFGISAALTAVGTYARTGVIALAVLAAAATVYSKRKAKLVAGLAVAAVVASPFLAVQWIERMGTLGNVGSEVSAMGRLGVWQWTLDYVASHPWGGSFGVYRINTFEIQLDDGSLLTGAAKAFHSIYFEILGELGYPGLILFMLIVLTTIGSLMAVKKAASDDWTKDLATCTLVALLVYLAAGAFIGVAFQPFFYHLASIAVVLQNLQARETRSRLHTAKPTAGLGVRASAFERKL